MNTFLAPDALIRHLHHAQTPLNVLPYSDRVCKLLQSAIFLTCCLLHNVAAADVKVAFVADQGTDSNALAVLQLIRDEGTELLLIQGDLGYDDEAAQRWENNLDQILGKQFPILTVVGNHENFEWPAYKTMISERIDRVAELSCTGDYGVMATCSFRGLEVVQVAPGIATVDGVDKDNNYAGYIEQQFSASQAPWRICSWHMNHRLMQIGAKPDETGWGVYQACLRHGALVATGHEHSYSRTHLLSDFSRQVIAHTHNHLELTQGQSFAFVSGLGGRGIRAQEITGPWWAAAYSSTQNANFGALFCHFASDTADCYFKDVSGAVPDSFTLETQVDTTIQTSRRSGFGSFGLFGLLITLLPLGLRRCTL